MYLQVCDECGKPAIGTVNLQTGYVYKDSRQIGQAMDFCEQHAPEGMPLQPRNCKRIMFVWPKEQRPCPMDHKHIREAKAKACPYCGIVL